MSAKRPLKPFQCQECQMSYGDKRDLQNHCNRVHKKVKPFKCALCQKHFSVIRNLQAHIESLHEKKLKISNVRNIILDPKQHLTIM